MSTENTTATSNGEQGSFNVDAVMGVLSDIPKARAELQRRKEGLLAEIAEREAKIEEIDANMKKLGKGEPRRLTENEQVERVNKVFAAIQQALKTNKGAPVKGGDITKVAKSDKFKLTSQDVVAGLRKLLEDKKIVSEGKNRQKTYALPKQN